jgi:hypothetical protein
MTAWPKALAVEINIEGRTRWIVPFPFLNITSSIYPSSFISYTITVRRKPSLFKAPLRKRAIVYRQLKMSPSVGEMYARYTSEGHNHFLSQIEHHQCF